MTSTVAKRKPARVLHVPRTQNERRAETRQKLLQATIETLHQHGYAHMTINDVARRAGLTAGAMQHHFPSKDVLLLAVLEEVFPGPKIEMEPADTLRLPLRARVDLIIDLFWEIYASPAYVVTWEIFLGTRMNKPLAQRISTFRRGIKARDEKWFADLFPDVDLPRAVLCEIASFVKDNLRGMTLLSVFQKPGTAAPLQLQLLKRATYDFLTGGAQTALVAKPRAKKTER